MHKTLLIFIVLLFYSCAATEPWHSEKSENWRENKPQLGAKLSHRLILAGDMGDPVIEGEDPVLNLIQSRFGNESNSSLFFLGNHIFESGLPPEDATGREEAEQKLNTILSAANKFPGSVYFTPGNKDWENGLNGLKAQHEFIKNAGNQNVNYMPRAGCPGPETVEVGVDVLLLIVDSEWFFRRDNEQVAAELNCENQTLEEMALAIEEIAENHSDKHIVYLAHHPFISRGKHAGFFTWKEHFFPLTDVEEALWFPIPVAGSFYPVLRNMGINRQDLSSASYDDYEDFVLDFLRDHPSVIVAGAHDHALQYFTQDGIHHIVSGSGSRTSIAREGGVADFVYSGKGFAVIEFYNDGSAWLEMWTAEDKFENDNPVYRTKIHGETRILNEEGLEQEFTLPDSIIVSTDTQYDIGSFGRTILGEHYRKSWIMPVKYPILDLRRTKGGLKINSMGGGLQTTTFFVENNDGERFVLRSIPKDPTENLPKVLQRTFIRDLLQDQISASNPFGPLIVSPIASAAGIYYAVPEAYYLPDDPALGLYRDEGKEKAVLLEEFVAPPLIKERFGDEANDTRSTEDLLEHLYDHPKEKIDDKWFLRSRLVDMILNDWDRHEGQFFWASIERDDGSITYKAFPIDRDNVIFKMDGVLPWIANRKWALRQFQHFDYDIRDIAGMNFQAQHLDRRVLAELEKEYWIEIAEDLRESVTDDAIEQGVRYLPGPVYDLRGEEIIDKLKSRRDKVVEFAERYYEYLAKQLEIVGTRQPDLFVIEEVDGSENLLLKRYAGLEENPDQLVFERAIDPDETKQVRMYGISGDDHFLFKNREKLPVKFHIVGGEGEARLTYANLNTRSAHNVDVHPKKIKGAYLKNIKENMGEFTTEGMEQYGYNYQEYAFDFIAPALQFSLNKDDGVFLGGGFSVTKYGFRKYPYAQRHRFTSSVATSKLSYNFLYEGEFTHLIGDTDLLIDGLIQSPNFQRNFFGLGNETVKVGNDRFHDIRQDVYSLNPILRYRIFAQSEFQFGPTFEVVDVRDTGDKFASTPQAGLQPDDFSTFKFLGVKSSYTYSNVIDPNYPRNGFSVTAGGHFTHNLDDDEPLFKLDLSTSFYHTIKNTEITFATRVGGAKNFGNFRFFQANTLGDTGPFFQSNTGVFDQGNFRGVLRDRFSGKTIFFQNTEIRSKLLEINSYFIPGTLGILALVDHGRVWIPNESSNTWHYALGGGLWYNFFDRVVVSVTYGNSDVDDSFSLVLGFLF